MGYKISMLRLSPLVILTLAPASALCATYTVFDVPGVNDTLALCVDNAGQVAGLFELPPGLYHSFVRSSDGTITTFDPEGAVQSVAYSIKGGWIGGYYYRRRDHSRGYLRSPDGILRSVRVAESYVTNVNEVNKTGIAVGRYLVKEGGMHSFVRTAAGITTFDPSGAEESEASAVNDAGEIAGYYTISGGGGEHGYVRTADGAIVSYDIPGSIGIAPIGINKRGMVVGEFADATGIGHGYLHNDSGELTIFDVPGAVGGTHPTSLNNAGDAAGWYQISQGGYGHGFIRMHNGAFTEFDLDGGSLGTYAMGINSSGVVVGYYEDGSSFIHSFIRTP